MSQTLEQFIIDNPEKVLKSFKTHDITLLKNELIITAEKILSKFGKFDVNEKGLPDKTINEVFESMPDSTKKMFWSINNASALIESLLNFNNDLEEEVKRMRIELSQLQIEYSRLQIELNK